MASDYEIFEPSEYPVYEDRLRATPAAPYPPPDGRDERKPDSEEREDKEYERRVVGPERKAEYGESSLGYIEQERLMAADRRPLERI